MNLLDEIQADLMNETVGISKTLRKARVLAHGIESPELAEWVELEMGGYPNDDSVPSYRHFSLPIFGTFHSAFQNRTIEAEIPTSNFGEPVREVLSARSICEGVGAIEDMLTSNHDMFHVLLPMDVTLALKNHVTDAKGLVLRETYHQITRHILAGILENVKGRLLVFVLDLQEKGVTSESINNDAGASELVKNSPSIHIGPINILGNNNAVTTGENVHQEFKPIHKGDVTSLIEHLRDYNVAEEDLGELKEAVASEPNMTGAGFVPKVMAWIGKMTTKVTSGVWQAGTDALAVLVKALKAFYGS